MACVWLASAFSSAFLLFVAQPLLARWLLPAFGGSPGTWAACMVFFQLMLLLGYGYAHLLSRWRGGPLVHAVFALAAGGFAFARRNLPLVAAESGLPPELHISSLLLAQVGGTYLLLSSSAPLLQRWAALALRQRAPHQLYAVSNAGSLLALLAYPTLLEGALPLGEQYRGWSYACMLFSFASSSCALITWCRTRAVAIASEPLPISSGVAYGRGPVYWVACSFVPSLFLLAVTNHITVDVAPAPLFWVVPLALYLLSFIAAFGPQLARWQRWAAPLFALSSVLVAADSFGQGSTPLWRQLGFPLAALFSASLACHAALVQARPEPERLTSFYLWIAFGGALGSVYVSLIAPQIWNDYYELELALMLSYALLLARATDIPDAVSSADDELAPRRSGQRRWLWLGFGACAPLLLLALTLRAAGEVKTGHVLTRRRSFLGALRVTQFDVGRVLTHGRIRHGMQLSDPARRDWPTMYFGRGTAIASVLSQQGVGRRIGVVGLGVGTLAAYGRAGDVVRFYELDPDVVTVAQDWFTFLRDTPARVELAVGDGRLLLSREPSQRFDVLVLDAFSSDAVPSHLLTREAFSIYLRHLAPDGALLANVSNRHLAVERVVRAAARNAGLSCSIVETAAEAAHFVSKVRWAVLARRPERLAALLEGLEPAANSGEDVLWTDARTSLWSILR